MTCTDYFVSLNSQCVDLMAGNVKKRIIVSFKKLPEGLQEKLLETYPGKLVDHARKIPKGPKDFFYALDLETDDTNYLVKIDVDFDKTLDEGRIQRMLENEEGARESQRMFYRSGFGRE